MSALSASKPSFADVPLEVIQLGGSDWRVADPTMAPDDPFRILGYIEKQRSNRFEILWMTDPMIWGYAASFDQALSAFSDSARFTGTTSTKRVVDATVTNAASSVRSQHRSTWRKRSRRLG